MLLEIGTVSEHGSNGSSEQGTWIEFSPGLRSDEIVYFDSDGEVEERVKS